jgi:hypothetical protein
MALWYVLGRRQVVRQAHVEPVALLRAEIIEDGLDLSQGHLLLQVGQRGLPSFADGPEGAWSEPLGSQCSCAECHCM